MRRTTTTTNSDSKHPAVRAPEAPILDILMDDGTVRTGISSILLPYSVTSPSALWLYRQRRHDFSWARRSSRRHRDALLELLPTERSIYDLFWEDQWWYGHMHRPINTKGLSQRPCLNTITEELIERCHSGCICVGTKASNRKITMVQWSGCNGRSCAVNRSPGYGKLKRRSVQRPLPWR